MIYRPLSVLPDNIYYAYAQSIKITWKNSGDTMYAFRIYVYDNNTNLLKYDSTEIVSYTPIHTISQTLPIGEYKFKIVVYNNISSNVNRSSAESDFRIFHVLVSPTLTLNLNDNDTISSQTLSLSANYSHPNNVKHKYYQFILMDEFKNVIERSPFITDSKFEYTYETLLENNVYYHAQCTVYMYEGIEASTDKIKFKTVYIKPTVSFNIEVETYLNKPSASLKWTVARIIGTIVGNGFFVDINNSPTPDEDYNNSVRLNVIADGAKAIFNEGILIENDFTANFWMMGIPENKEFFVIKSANGKIYLTYYNNRIHIWKDNSLVLIHGASKEVYFTNEDMVMIRIQQDGKRIGVYAQVE